LDIADQFFESIEDLESEIAYMVLCDVEWCPWEDFDDDELREWCDVIDRM